MNGIGLVVAQADVEARPVLLDEALLGEQRLGLAGDDDALDRARSSRPSPRARDCSAPAPWRSARRRACAPTWPCRRRSRGPARRGTGTRRAGRAARGAARRGSRRLAPRVSLAASGTRRGGLSSCGSGGRPRMKRPDDEADQHEPGELAEARLPHPARADVDEQRRARSRRRAARDGGRRGRRGGTAFSR